MTIARKLSCKNENCPHETLKGFSDWVRHNLPDSRTGYMATDMDFILYNYKTKNLVILEVKTRNSDIKEWQRIFCSNLHKWILKGIDSDWTFHGVWLLQFEKDGFSDGKVFLNRSEISELELVKKLSFVD